MSQGPAGQVPAPTPAKQVTATFYAQVKAKITKNRWDATIASYVDQVDSITVQTITQKRPAKPASGCVVVKLQLRFNEAAFLPLSPSAVVDIPDSLIMQNQVITVVADDPNDAAAVAVAAAAARAAVGRD